MRVPRLRIADPGLTSLKAAARPAIVMPAVFAIADKVIQQPQTATFAAFGSFAMLVFASFTGPWRSRLTAYLTLAVAGAALVAVGTLCSGNAWLAAGAMAVVGFLILFSGVINGYFAAGGSAAILAFVIADVVPAPAAEIGWRLAGWGMASVAGIAAAMLLWPPRDRASLRADAARACLALADLAGALAGARQVPQARTAAAQQAVQGLRGRLAVIPHRPTGPTGPAVALAALVDELSWLMDSLAALGQSPQAELCAAENAETMLAVAAVLRASSAELSGQRDQAGLDVSGLDRAVREQTGLDQAALHRAMQDGAAQDGAAQDGARGDRAPQNEVGQNGAGRDVASSRDGADRDRASSRDGAGPDWECAERLDLARESAVQGLARQIAGQPVLLDDKSLAMMVDRPFRVHAIAYTTQQIAGYARAASAGPDAASVTTAPPAVTASSAATPGPAGPGTATAAGGSATVDGPTAPDPVTAGVASPAAPGPAAPGPGTSSPGTSGPGTSGPGTSGPGTSSAGGLRRARPANLIARLVLWAEEDFAAAHASARSVWFRNSVRGAAGLAIAVFIAQKSGLQHSFWVVLGTLSVLRSNALGTGWTVLTALAGTAVGILAGAAILIPVGSHDTVLWAILPVAVLLAAYAPRVISFAAGQAAFTVVILILFNIIQPAGWRVGLVRIEDVAIGFAVSLGVGLVFWPRGAAALLRSNLAEAYSRSADYVAVMVAQLTSTARAGDAVLVGTAATAAVHRLDDSFSQYIAERSAKRTDPATVTRMVAGAARVLRAGQSLADLDRAAVSGPEPLPAGAALCGAGLTAEAQTLRSWFVTLGDSVVNGTSTPPPQHRDLADRRHMLQCAREAIGSGDPVAARGALLALWTSEHLDALWRMEKHLAPPSALGTPALAAPPAAGEPSAAIEPGPAGEPSAAIEPGPAGEPSAAMGPSPAGAPSAAGEPSPASAPPKPGTAAP